MTANGAASFAFLASVNGHHDSRSKLLEKVTGLRADPQRMGHVRTCQETPDIRELLELRLSFRCNF